MADDAPMPVFESKEPGVVEPARVDGAGVSGVRLDPVTPRMLAKLKRTHPAHFPGARGLVLGWCIWLLGSWAVLLPMEGPMWAVRGMIVVAVVGLMVIWPLVRLSQPPEVKPSQGRRVDRYLPVAGVLIEWLSLMAVFQAVVWPLRLTGGWGLAQALWLDGAVAAWSLLTGALIAMGTRMGGVGRSVMMAMCLLLLLAEPVFAALWPGGWEMRVCPIPTVWALTGPSSSWHRDPWASHVIAAAAGAAVAWAGVMISRMRRDGPVVELT